jgi:hypothetical protein
MHDGDKLKIGEAKQGSLLVLEHLEDILEVKRSSVEPEPESVHEFGSDGLQELEFIEQPPLTKATSRIQNHEPVEPRAQRTPDVRIRLQDLVDQPMVLGIVPLDVIRFEELADSTTLLPDSYLPKSSSLRASPKSATTGLPEASIRMLPGLTSRWTSPRVWA